MRRRSFRRWTLAVAAGAVAALAAAGISGADMLRHDLDGGGVVTTTPGGSVTVSWRVTDNPRDNVCDAADGTPAVVTLQVADTDVSPALATLTFAACGVPQSVTFSVAATAAPGDRIVSASLSDAGGGAYDTNGAGLTIRVEAPAGPDTAAPVITVPGTVIAEATGPGGATVSFAVTATDNVDGAVSVACTPPPGSTFAIGTTTVQCSAQDSAGNGSTASFDVTVRDTTPPALSLPPPLTAAASSAAGAAVAFVPAPSASDTVDGTVAVSCSHASGAVFPVGTTTVECSAQDTRGNRAVGSFTVTVTNAAPTVTVPSTQVAEATGPTGARVHYVPPPSASDPEDGPLVPVCSPASGSLFPLGTTTVTCTARDSIGTQGTSTFLVVVRDTTPPVLIPPADIVVVSTGAEVTQAHEQVARFLGSAQADDLVSTPRIVHDAPPVFPVGRTVVTFTAIDAAGNVAAGTAVVEVRPPPAPGQPVPPPPPVVERQPPGNVTGLRVKPLDRAVRLEWRHGARATRYQITRSERDGTSRVVFDGRATAFTDRGLLNGNEYRYVVVSFNAAGLRSVGVAIVAVPARPMLVRPAHGAALRRPPTLTWRAVSRASYYNVQLFRVRARGSELVLDKVLSVWPVRPAFQLRSAWRYERRRMRLSPGTYEWYVWAGFGARASRDYSPLLGWSSFTIRRR